MDIYEIVSQKADAILKAETGKSYIGSIRGTHRYDLYLQLIFSLLFFDKKVSKNNLICVDEGQDLTSSEYELLVAVNEEKPVFNIYGDTYQLLKYKRGIDDWKKVLSIIGETVEQRVLNANYGNTNQIISYFNNSLKMDIIPIGQDGHNVKDINRYSFERTLSKLKMSEERIAIILPRKVDKNKYLDYEQISYEVKERIGDGMGNGKIALVYVDEVKGIEFDRVFVVPNGMTKNERYIAYTRALSDLTIVVDESLDDVVIEKRIG